MGGAPCKVSPELNAELYRQKGPSMRTSESESSPAVSPGAHSVGRPPIQPGEDSFLLKRCSKCGETKSKTDFSRDRNKFDGLCVYCRACRKAANAAWYAKNKTQACSTSREWYSKNKERGRKNAMRWYTNNKKRRRETARAWLAAHKETHKQSTRKWRARNLDRHRQLTAQWSKNNPGRRRSICLAYRARKYASPGSDYTTAQHIKWRWEMWGNRCWMCGDAATATDHVIALAKGGSHWPANLRPICKSCNSRKGAKKISELDIGAAPYIQCADA